MAVLSWACGRVGVLIQGLLGLWPSLAQNCPREELELELEPLQSAAALRAFEGKAFTVVAFDFGFLAFSKRLLLTFAMIP